MQECFFSTTATSAQTAPRPGGPAETGAIRYSLVKIGINTTVKR